MKKKTLATLITGGPHTDLENLTVTTDPRFMAMIERSRRLHPPGTGISSDDVRQDLGLRRRGPNRKLR